MRQIMDDLYERISNTFNELIEKEEEKSTAMGFEKLVSMFEDISDTLQCLMIPFTLSSKTESVLQEAVTDYKAFIKQYGQLLRYIKTFNSASQNKPIEDNNGSFARRLDNCIKDVVDFYNQTMLNEKNTKQVEHVQKAYYAYLMLSRVLNTAIKVKQPDLSEGDTTHWALPPLSEGLNFSNIMLLI
ncbi:MAG: hypothetical protein J6J27_02290 [Alphaproteobacteria bacterium]|nr:hypothetical protein [Alphaproteobacteria bacterium]